MLYKPNFCCQCGEKIQRVDWNLRTSRRFCDLCQTEFTVYEWMPKIGLGIGLILGIFFIGSFFQASNKKENVFPVKHSNGSQQNRDLPDQKKNKQLAEIPNNQTQIGNLSATPSVQTQTNSHSAAVLNQDLERKKQAESIQSRQNDKKEPVYFCGAETKKGTPCSRRVKGGGRCWQHEGKTAMLPENQLSVSQ